MCCTLLLPLQPPLLFVFRDGEHRCISQLIVAYIQGVRACWDASALALCDSPFWFLAPVWAGTGTHARPRVRFKHRRREAVKARTNVYTPQTDGRARRGCIVATLSRASRRKRHPFSPLDISLENAFLAVRHTFSIYNLYISFIFSFEILITKGGMP